MESPLFRHYASTWLDRAEKLGVRCVKTYESIVVSELIPAFGDRSISEVTRQEYRAWLAQLRVKTTRRGTQIAPRTVRNINILLQQIFSAAVDDELIPTTPIRPARGDMPKMRDADSAWRAGAVFSRDEVRALLLDPRLPEPRRMAFALEFFLGVRAGELAGLRWSAWAACDQPLGHMLVSKAWNTRKREMQSPKNGEGRKVPVHPSLRSLLERWFTRGWWRAYGRQPTGEDFIVSASVGVPLANSVAWRWLTESCDDLGIRTRGSHIARATFCTLLQEDGADPNVVERLSHGSPSGLDGGRVLAGYTRFSYSSLCEAMSCLKLELAIV